MAIGQTMVMDETTKKIFRRFPANHPAHLPLMLIYYTGCSVKEAYNIRSTDLDLENRIWHCETNDIWLCDEIVRAINDQLYKINSSQILFLYRNDERYLNIYLQTGKKISPAAINHITKVIHREIDPDWSVKKFRRIYISHNET